MKYELSVLFNLSLKKMQFRCSMGGPCAFIVVFLCYSCTTAQQNTPKTTRRRNYHTPIFFPSSPGSTRVPPSPFQTALSPPPSLPLFASHSTTIAPFPMTPPPEVEVKTSLSLGPNSTICELYAEQYPSSLVSLCMPKTSCESLDQGSQNYEYRTGPTCYIQESTSWVCCTTFGKSLTPTTLSVLHNTSESPLTEQHLESSSEPVSVPSNTDHRLRRLWGEQVRVMGWGTIGYGDRLSNALHEVDVDIVSREKCIQSYEQIVRPFPELNLADFAAVSNSILLTGSQGPAWPYRDGFPNTILCAARNGKDSCQGDSGGPLLLFGKCDEIRAAQYEPDSGLDGVGFFDRSRSSATYSSPESDAMVLLALPVS
ncbi:unnamed protein product [Cyprideis torosa]|uniref:Uncharacterized protein n=1 Tax=Cyprideis torosa TaxID=163714 RepID=A0A7R8ZRK6_9CRUS|nr:unnamed protein product [Cyprideis torosa]CAG0893395.1 unnamed protein product [Cyprideis torosa]